MKVLNSDKNLIRVRVKGKLIKFELIDPQAYGWIRIFKLPNGKCVGQTTMISPVDWKFICSIYLDKDKK